MYGNTSVNFHTLDRPSQIGTSSRAGADNCVSQSMVSRRRPTEQGALSGFLCLNFCQLQLASDITPVIVRAIVNWDPPVGKDQHQQENRRPLLSRRAPICTGDEIIADTPGRSDSMHARSFETRRALAGGDLAGCVGQSRTPN